MPFEEDIVRLGFSPAEDRAAKRFKAYSASPNRYLTYWLHAYEDGTALLTWEFAVADYLTTKGIQLGSAEALNLFMFPIEDQRGPQDPAWVVAAMDRVEAGLADVDFAHPEG